MLRNTMRYRVRPASVDVAARRESAVNKATNGVNGRGKREERWEERSTWTDRFLN